MYDIEKYIKAFDIYCNSFVVNCKSDNTIQNLNLKIVHSKNVLMHCENIAKSENLNDEEYFIAQLCGLFHDIGRFEQFTTYNTFRDDDSIYHGALGAEVLEKEGFLSDLDIRTQGIVIKAILNHGLIAIPQNTVGDELYFSKLVRDADKADIFGIVAKYYHSSGPRNIALEYGLADIKEISACVLEKFLDRQMISKDDLKTLNDFKLMQLAWIFDLNFVYTKRFFINNNFAEAILSSITDDTHKEKIKSVIEESLQAY